MRPHAAPVGGSVVWQLWSEKGAMASVKRGVMRLIPLGVNFAEATLARVEKYKARGFRLVSDGSLEQQKLFQHTMAGCCRLSKQNTSRYGLQDRDVIVDDLEQYKLNFANQAQELREYQARISQEY